MVRIFFLLLEVVLDLAHVLVRGVALKPSRRHFFVELGRFLAEMSFELRSIQGQV